MTTLDDVKARLGLPAAASEREVLAAVDRAAARHRDGLIAAALADGRIVDGSAWREQLDREPAKTEAQLAALTPAVAPVREQQRDLAAQVEAGLAAAGARTERSDR
jgi:hypothetical protein